MIMMSIGVAAAQEDPPAVPAEYYGEVMINGEPAEDGVIVEAEVNGTVQDSLTIEGGQYGGTEPLDERLTVGEPDSGSGTDVEFYIDGNNFNRILAETIQWESGDLRQVDLDITVSQEDDGTEDDGTEDDGTEDEENNGDSNTGGSGGGGSGISGSDDDTTDDAQPTVIDVRDTLNLVEPSTTTQTEIADNNPDTPGTQITPEGTESVQQISFDEDELSGNVDITEYTNPPQQIREDVASSVTAAGAAAEGSSINTISVADITPDNDAAEDSAATVTFAVPASEVTNPEQLTVFKETYSQEQQEDTWTELDTSVEQEGDEEITVSARAESFSLFAVSEVEPADDDQQQQDDGQDDGQDDDQQPDDDNLPTSAMVLGLLVVVAIVGASFYARNNK